MNDERRIDDDGILVFQTNRIPSFVTFYVYWTIKVWQSCYIFQWQSLTISKPRKHFNDFQQRRTFNIIYIINISIIMFVTIFSWMQNVLTSNGIAKQELGVFVELRSILKASISIHFMSVVFKCSKIYNYLYVSGVEYEVWSMDQWLDSFMHIRKELNRISIYLKAFLLLEIKHNFSYKRKSFVRILVFSTYFTFDLLSNNNIIGKSNNVANVSFNSVTSVHVCTSGTFGTWVGRTYNRQKCTTYTKHPDRRTYEFRAFVAK